MKNSEIIEGAAEVIRKHGWAKGSFGAPGWGYCLAGAARRAQAENGILYSATQTVCDIIEPGVQDDMLRWANDHADRSVGLNPIFIVNDYFCNTPQDALDILDRAAKHWRNLGE